MKQKPFKRSDRVGGQIQKVLSDLLKKKIKDPRLETATITDVQMAPDLKLAYIYYILNDKEKNKEAVEGFNSAKGFIKRKLAQQLGLRYMPQIKFFYDKSFDYGAHINSVLKTIKADDEENHTAS